MKPPTALLALLALLALALLAPPARAHGTRSVTVDLTEVSPGRAVVHVRASTPGDRVDVHVAEPCTTAPAGEDDDGGGDAGTFRVECPGALAGQTISVGGLGPIVSEAILVAALHDGTRVSRVLTAEEPSLRLPERQSGPALAAAYVRLGVVHIATGYDHLLFLLSLVLLLRRWRSVLWAETAFTVSHSLSFSATALGLVHVSSAAAEACIALSLLLVALDVGKTKELPGAREGAGLAFVFGLVHGLGFAGGLSEIGLPDHDVSVALLGFAAGIEIGQVAFLAVALGVFAWIASRPRLAFAPRAGATLIGAVSAYWLIERLTVCFAASARV
jgi:NADH:ubiquinone oxidoreductase subunit K